MVPKKGKNEEISCFNELFEGLKASPPGAYTSFLVFIKIIWHFLIIFPWHKNHCLDQDPDSAKSLDPESVNLDPEPVNLHPEPVNLGPESVNLDPKQ
jgi:hypothetical protein